MARPAKSPELRDAEKRVERRQADVIAAARSYRVARRSSADTRPILSDLDDAVADLEAAEREVTSLSTPARCGVENCARELGAPRDRRGFCADCADAIEAKERDERERSAEA